MCKRTRRGYIEVTGLTIPRPLICNERDSRSHSSDKTPAPKRVRKANENSTADFEEKFHNHGPGVLSIEMSLCVVKISNQQYKQAVVGYIYEQYNQIKHEHDLPMAS